jgi:hypothetical protein
MTNTSRNILIAAGTIATNSIILATGYVWGKRDGLKLAAKQQAELNAAPVHNSNRRVDQAQA